MLQNKMNNQMSTLRKWTEDEEKVAISKIKEHSTATERMCQVILLTIL